MDNHYIEDGSWKCTLTNSNNKKNVFLIGDSIRMGYCKWVKKILDGKSNVFFPNDNCRNTQYILTSLGGWESITNFSEVDLVFFNAGHWDIAHWEGETESLTPIDEYEKNIGRIIERLNLSFPKAKIFFITTTPMNPNGATGRNPRNNREIIEYNAAAINVAKEKGIPIIDAFSLMKDKGEEYFRDYCHFTEESYEIIANHIVKYVEKELNI